MRGVVFGMGPAKTIRTYNYKRGLVTDHRTGVILSLRQVLSGDIAAFVAASCNQSTEHPMQAEVVSQTKK